MDIPLYSLFNEEKDRNSERERLGVREREIEREGDGTKTFVIITTENFLVFFFLFFEDVVKSSL